MSKVRKPVSDRALALSALLPLVAGSLSLGMVIQFMVVRPSWYMGLYLLALGALVSYNCWLLYSQLRLSYTLSVFMEQLSVGEALQDRGIGADAGQVPDSDEWSEDWDKAAAELDRLDRLANPSMYLVPGIITHGDSQCAGEYCSIHNPSEHPLADAPLHWRADRRLMERICDHGVGHPDPDDLAHRRLSDELADDVHGCDGCCQEVSSDE